jgi:hypothetical protein
MEETFSSDWAKESADKYLSPSYCTIGKLMNAICNVIA